MVKPVRKAVRCYLIKDDNVLVTKYKEGNKKYSTEVIAEKVTFLSSNGAHNSDELEEV